MDRQSQESVACVRRQKAEWGRNETHQKERVTK